MEMFCCRSELKKLCGVLAVLCSCDLHVRERAVCIRLDGSQVLDILSAQ